VNAGPLENAYFLQPLALDNVQLSYVRGMEAQISLNPLHG
jgi:hypothetical protein